MNFFYDLGIKLKKISIFGMIAMVLALAVTSLTGYAILKEFTETDILKSSIATKVNEAPSQIMLQPPYFFTHNGLKIKVLADFTLKAKLLSKEHYRFDRAAKISPYDVALGWQQMSDNSFIEKLDISQSGRWYHYSIKSKNDPINFQTVSEHSSNMHLVPTDEEIIKKVKKAPIGSIVYIKGNLINVYDDIDGHSVWKSSLTRKDTGNGACEIILVRDFAVVEQ